MAGGRRTVPLPRFNPLKITPISASPLPEGAGDGVGDISRYEGRALRGGRSGQRHRGAQAATPGSSRARHAHPDPPLLDSARVLLVPVEGPLLQDGVQVAPQAALRAVVAAGREFGDLERRVGLPVTAPLDGLQLAADAVHWVVATTWLGRVIVHDAGGGDGEAAELASWLEERLKSEEKKERKVSWRT